MPWFSRMQKCVTLSTTEAEYVAIADRVEEALNMRGTLTFAILSLGPMNIGVFEDNMWVTDLAKNAVSSPNTRQVDVRYHSLRDLAAVVTPL